MTPALIASREPASRRAVDRALLPGRTVRVAAGHGGVVRVREGELWITFEASGEPLHWDRRDHFIRRGQGLVLAAGEVIVISASDPRHGRASFDWQPFPVPRPIEPPGLASLLRRLLGPLRPALPTRLLLA